jgi:hypothetical protein
MVDEGFLLFVDFVGSYSAGEPVKEIREPTDPARVHVIVTGQTGRGSDGERRHEEQERTAGTARAAHANSRSRSPRGERVRVSGL